MAELHARTAGVRMGVAPAVILCCLILAPLASAARTPRSGRVRYAKVRPACPAPRPGNATCFAFVRVPMSSAAAAEPGVQPYAVNDGASESGPSEGLTPAQLASAYGYEPTSGGSGQTVAIVDAYNDPAIEEDLATFDAEYGIPACTKGNGCFTKVSQTGSATSLPAADETGWSLEIALDVETVHSTCPNCKILLVEAENSAFTNLAAAVNEAVALGATEVSNSYGGPETELGARVAAAYNHPGVVISAASGDEGYYDWTELNEERAYKELSGELGEELNEGISTPGVPNLPATFPSVVAVGGTTLNLTGEGTRESETVWNGDGPEDEDGGQDQGATGGGCSTLFAAEPWQQQAPGYAATNCAGKRLSADVSAVANPLTGFAVYDSYDCGFYCEIQGYGDGWSTIGGTSLSTPFISALYALAGGSDGVSYPSLTLYGHLGDPSSAYDVTEGGNGFCDQNGFACGANTSFAADVDCEGTTACNAVPGFDGPSGVGTPNGLGLFKPRLPTASFTLPSSPQAGLAASFNGGASSDPYPGGAVSSYSWSWGDGTADSAGVAPTHTYAAPGEYTVSLAVTDSYGVASTAVTQSVKVSAQEVAVQEVSAFHASIPPPAPDAGLARTSLKVSFSGAVTLQISCPAGVSECSGTITLRTLKAVSVSGGHAPRQKPSILTLAMGSFTVAGGKLRTITLHLSKEARALLARSHTLRARATLVARDPQGASHTTRMIVTLHAPKARHQ
jgi:subtilase family serine protease